MSGLGGDEVANPDDGAEALLPLTYVECRERFRRAAAAAGAEVGAHRIAAVGRHGEELTIDEAWFGPPEPARVLVVLSGVHGVEGFIGSAVQTAVMATLATAVGEAIGVLIVHAVNPWGMSWGRRQNEHNVDLNRNWRRSDDAPPVNEAYDLLHPIACPASPEAPSTEVMFGHALELVAERGEAWVREGITAGQYRHPDGLHYGGDRTEASTLLVDRIVGDRVGQAEKVIVVDLHTGHGPWAHVTLLSDAAPGSSQDELLRTVFPGRTVEPTIGNPSATTGPKFGQIANGIRDKVIARGGDAISTSAEFGTVDDMEQLEATFLESWLHRRGGPPRLGDDDIAWRYRTCFTPADEDWSRQCLGDGVTLVSEAFAGLAGWT